MERWEIRSAPTADDPQRHLLLLRGSMADVSAILKKFGALCGRPTPLDGDDFNLSLVLHRMTPKVREKLDDFLGKMAPPSSAVVAPAPAVAAPAVAEVPPAAPAVPAAAPPSSIPPAQPPSPTSGTSPVAAPHAQGSIRLSPASSVTESLHPEWTFENLLVGAYNRFAHAAAMSVVSSPGSMYNPLFLYGAAGVGKSHLLHAIANAMSKGLGDAGIMVTSGSRLARAVSVAAARGSMAEIEKKAADSSAIFVDDIHLMGVTDQNKEFLARLFKFFFDKNLQVVLTSLYPPRTLGALEEALKFSFSKGWSVDLKIPSPNVQKDLVVSVCERAGAQFSVEETALLYETLSRWGYQELTLWINRLLLLRRMRQAARQPAQLKDLLCLTYAPIVAGGSEPPLTLNTSVFSPPAAGTAAELLAVIAPRSPEGVGPFAASLFHKVGDTNGFSRQYRHVLWETYDAAQQVGVPFQIGDMCYKARATRALIVGPGPDSPLALRAHEFGQAVRRILESTAIPTGWVPFSGLQIGAHYLNAHLDFEKT